MIIYNNVIKQQYAMCVLYQSLEVQSSAVTTWSNITWYSIAYITAVNEAEYRSQFETTKYIP